MKACTFELNIGGTTTSYTSEEALNDALLKEVFSDKDKIPIDIVFSKKPGQLKARETIIKLDEEAKRLKDVFREAKRKAKNIDSEIILDPDPPFIGVTKYLSGKRNSKGTLLTPEFDIENYWSERIASWKQNLTEDEFVNGSTDSDGNQVYAFNTSEIRLLSDGNTDEDRRRNFFNKHNISGRLTLSDTEINSIRKAVEQKWKKINTEGTAIHYVMQMYFTELKDSSGKTITDGNGNILHVFDLTTPKYGYPTMKEYIKQRILAQDETSLRTEMGSNFDENLITDSLLDSLIQFADSFKQHIETVIPGGDLQFFPETELTSDLATTESGPNKLLGIIDLLVVDKYGNAHIFDYKCSDKMYDGNDIYEGFSSAKKRGFYYQQAIYNRMLIQHGIRAGRGQIRIVPITLKDFKCTNKDELLVNPENAQFTFDGVINSSAIPKSIDIKPAINKASSNVNTPSIMDNIDEFLPEADIEDATPEGTNEYVSKYMQRIFKDKNYRDDDIEQQIRDDGGFEQKDDGKYHYRPSFSQEIITDTPEDLVEQVKEVKDKQAKRQLNLSETVFNALKYGQEHDTTDIQEIIRYIDTRNVSEKYAFQGWFKNYLAKYCNNDWKVIDAPTARTWGVIPIKNVITKQIDFITLTVDKLKAKPYLEGNHNKYITRMWEDDSVEAQNNKSLILEDVWGNRDLLQTMLVINTMPGLFQNPNTKVGSIEIINPYDGLGLTATNEELQYTYSALKNKIEYDSTDTDNIESGLIKFANKSELVQNRLNEILNTNTEFKLKHEDIFNGCLNEFNEALTGGNKIKQIRALTKLIKTIESPETGFNIEGPSAEQLQNESQYSIVYNLYYDALIALGELQGIRFRQQLKESANIIEGGISKIFKNGISGLKTDNPGNLASETLNSITYLYMQAAQNMRRDMQQITADIRNNTKKLKEAKSRSYAAQFVQSDLGMYQNMYEVAPNGDLLFKNLYSISDPAERDYLQFALRTINKNRYNLTDEQCDTMERSGSLQYYRVPLIKTDRLSRAFNPVASKEDSDGNFVKTSNSLWSSFCDWIKSFYPKNALKDIKENIEGVFSEDDDAGYKNAEKLYNITTQFDANEVDSGGNNLENRLNVLKKYGTAYFEQDLQTLLLKHSYAYASKKRINEIIPTIKSSIAFLINMGNTQNTKFVNELKFLEDYLISRIKGQPLQDDPIIGNSKTSQNFKATVGKIRSAASFVALAFNPKQWCGQGIQGILYDMEISLMNITGDKKFSYKNLREARKEVSKDLFKYSEEPTKCQLINELYGINDMDMNQYADKLRSFTRHGFFNAEEIAYKCASRPDFYNRMTIVVCAMKADGVWDALSVKNGRLVYDWKKDKRFSAYANNDTSNMELYNEQKALYLAMANQFTIEHTLNDDGSEFQIGDALPTPYTNKEMENYKNICDSWYGYLTHEKRAMIHSDFLGGLFMQMRSYWSAKKNQYFAPGGVKLQGEWKQLTDSNGNLLYYQTDVNGNINTDLPPVTESELNSPLKIPFVQWKGRWQEGIILTCANVVRYAYQNKGLGIFNPFMFNREYEEYIRSLSPDMQIAYRANMRKLIADLMATLLMGTIIGGLATVGSKYLIKEAKASGNFSDATIASMFSIGADSWVYATDDFNWMKSISNPILEWNPFTVTTVSKICKSTWNVAAGDASAYQALTNTFSATREIKPILQSLAPDGGYILPHDENA